MGLLTYAQICVENIIRSGLLDKFILEMKNFRWTRILDYENTAFRCRTCQQTETPNPRDGTPRRLQNLSITRFQKLEQGTNSCPVETVEVLTPPSKGWEADQDFSGNLQSAIRSN